MLGEFDHFTSFFHQDAFVDGSTMQDIAKLALETMSSTEIESLVKFLDDLSAHKSSDVIILTWNESRSDLGIERGNAKEFIATLSNIARSHL